ncbi:restriction endonuclease subunit S [Streptomyces sp. NPDC001822]|uniref:restriction endonuclease subunit S n=1 Tax=Streptomyces sp. NPDC001822 TaxID=3364614 RepID=UPI00368F7AF2
MSAEGAVVYRRLDDIAQISGGLALGRSVSEREGVEVPYLRVANVQDGYIDTAEMKTVQVLPSEIERYRVREGDLLLTEGGDLDKLGRGAVWDSRIPLCLHQNHLFRVRSNRDVMLPEYLSAYVSSSHGKQYFLGVAKQTTNLATINSSQLKSMPIPCPDVNAQREVIRVLESVSEAEAAVESAIAKLRIMFGEVASSVIPKFLGSGESPRDRWIPVREAGSVRMGKQLSPAARSAPGQYPYLRVANVLDGRIDYSDVKTMGFTDGERRVYSLEPGDILLNEGQSLELVGRSAIYGRASGEFCFQNTLIQFRANDGILPQYAQAVFENWLAVGKFAQIAKRTTSIAHLGGERFGALEFPLVAIDEQRRVVKLLEGWKRRVSDEKCALDKLRALKRGIVDDLICGKTPADV